MAGNPNRLSQFWQELKRRKVLRSLAIYAGSAFIILEAATIIFPRWGLPDWTIDLVLYLLILGAFINIIVAWIFDITPEGVQKTKPVSEVRESDISTDSNAWKVVSYISLAVIVALIIFNVVPTNKELRPGPIESIVVLPFENLTGDDGLDITLSGMHTMLIRDMQRIGGLRTICKTSAISYKNKDMSIREITSELAVGAAIEPTVMCVGDSVCMHVIAITPYPEERTIWMADYIVERSQLPNLWNRITKQITDELMIELTSEEESLLAESRVVDPEAYDAYSKGLHYWERLSKEDLDSALHYFRIAIEKDPDWAEPYSGMALAWNVLGSFGYASLADSYGKASEYQNKALELDPHSANSHYVKAIYAVWTDWNWEDGEKEFLRTLELNPNNALCRIYYAHLLTILLRFDEAVYHANLALALDPLRPLVLGLYGVVMNHVGNHEAALVQTERAISIDPENAFALGPLAKAYLAIGDTLKWYESKKRHYYWTDEEYLASLDIIFQEHGYLAVIEERIRVNEEVYSNGGSVHLLGLARKCLALNDYDKAMDYFEIAYEQRFGFLPYFSLEVIEHPELKDNPRYIALLKKMNLPLPGD